VVTPATVKSRSGSASVKGTVRKQNEDRFASYVRISSRSSPQPRRVSALAVVATPRRRATTTDPYHTPSPTIRDSSRLFSSDARETSSFPCADTNATNVFDTR
jgi:hypothetical protein